MEPNFCPLLKAAGFINGKEACSEECAWYIRGRCALAVLAEATSSAADHLEEDALDDLLESCRH